MFELNNKQKSAVISDILNHLEIITDYATRLKNPYLLKSFDNMTEFLESELEDCNKCVKTVKSEGDKHE